MNNIKYVRLMGFRKFKDTTITFNEHLNIIVGENEAGKSTVVEAIEIVINQLYKNADKSIIKELINILRKTYPDAECSLDFKTPFELVVAVCLSAQCTDERVNLTTPALFERCKTIEDFVSIDLTELENLIHPCGFYKNKAKNIKKCASQILEDFNGQVPRDMKSLITLAGVGRKSANVIMLEVFGIAERYRS